MRYRTCHNHPGRIIENRSCPHCGHPAAPPTDRPPYTPSWTPPRRRHKEETVVEGTVTTMPESKPEVDVETGEVTTRQPTLDPTIFPATERRRVPMDKIGFSGSVEMTQSEWQAYCDQGLEPGRVVKVTLTGYLPNPHAKWVKRTGKGELGDKDTWWEQEGQIRVRVTELGRFEVTGQEWNE